MNKKGFTLAEVLITLGIIGIVAALTIPTLMQSTNSKDVVAKVKKARNVITNAINIGAAHEGLTSDTYYKGDDGHLYFKSFIKNTNVMKKPEGYEDTDEYYESGTWNNVPFYLSDGTKWSINYVNAYYGTKFTVDINGDKGPNREGNDIFVFYFHDGLLTRPLSYGLGNHPELCEGVYSSKNSVAADACANYILLNDNADYLNK